MKKFYVILMAFMAVSFSSFSQTWDGGGADDNWNTAANWSPNAVPASNANVSIPSGSTVVVTANVTVGSITFTLTNNPSSHSLTVNSGVTLTVTNGITVNNATRTSSTATIAGAGSITCASFTVGGTTTNLNDDHTITVVSTISSLSISGNLNINGEDDGSDDQIAIFNLQSGTVTVGGSINFDAETSDSPTTLTLASGAQTGTLVLSGATPIGTLGAGETFTANGTSATVNYNRSGTQTIRNVTYTNLILSGSNTKTLGGNTTVNGTLSMQGTAAFATGGNTLTYGAASTLEYAGSSAQTTTSTEFKTPGGPFNLKINNSNGVTLHAARSISGALTLTSGILTTTSLNLLTINAGGSTSGASDASFVDGPLKKAGNTAFSFPVGKTGVGYMKIDIASIANGTNDANTSFTAQYFRASAGSTFGNTGLLGLGLQGVSNCEYWTLDRVDASNDATANITMYWNAHSPCGSAPYLVDPILGLKIAHFNTNTSQWDAIGGGAPSGNASAGSLTWTGASSFSPFALAALVGSNSPLPVMFDNVKAYAKNNGVQIEWSNLTERELKDYVVERSADGRSFTNIAVYMPISNLNNKADYTSFDASPVVGTNFYRIRAAEIGGKIIYSKILKVDLSGKQSFSMYPNPVTGRQLTISLTGMAHGSYNIRVVNANGQDVFKKVIKNSSSSTSEMIELPASVKAGIYTMLINGDTFTATKMFVVQ